MRKEESIRKKTAFGNSLVAFLPLACTDCNNWEENSGSSKCCTAEDTGLTSCSLHQGVPSQGKDLSRRANGAVLLTVIFNHLRQKAGH